MKSTPLDLATVAHVIDIAVTPVFMLVGIAGFLAVLITRHGRTVDRSRVLHRIQSTSQDRDQLDSVQRERYRLARRMTLTHFAISMATFSAIIVCLVVATLFVGHLLALKVELLVIVLFIVCMLMLALAFCAFLGEVLVCTRTLQSALQHSDTLQALPINQQPRNDDRPQKVA